jgi:homoserine kinase type II
MTADLGNRVAATVVHEFPVAGERARLLPLGNRGGFSGARLWRVDSPGGSFCLKAWPPSGPSRERLDSIHRLMGLARGSGLAFVPAPARTGSGSTCIEYQGRLWDLTTWMPGQADFHTRPTAARLEAACTALAELHIIWSKGEPKAGVCPAIRRRLDRVRQWQALVRSGWQPAWEVVPDDPVLPWAERAWKCVRIPLEELPQRLAPWLDRRLPLQPCLCDVWHDHVLFEGDMVTALIDYGAVKADHVAVDLARLLGSLVRDDGALRTTGLRAYARLRSLSPEEDVLVDALDRSGVLVGLANWLEWLYREMRTFEDRQAVAGQLAELVLRAERW